MKLFQLFERTIQIPQEFFQDIYRMCIYSIYRYHTSGGADIDIQEFTNVIEDVTGLNMDALTMEFEGRFKRSVSAKGDFYGLSAVNVQDIPYYHSSTLIKQKLDSLPDDNTAILVFLMVREKGNSSYNPVKKSLTINLFELSTEFLRYWIDSDTTKTDKNLLKQISETKKNIDHEIQHMVQDIALPSEQSDIKKNYGDAHGGRTEQDVHNDYFTSPAEIRPQLSNIESNFRNAIADDEYWEIFSDDQRKELFKMFVGLSSESFNVSVGGMEVRISIPAKPYFKALKQDTPKLYKKVVKDFYNMVKDVF